MIPRSAEGQVVTEQGADSSCEWDTQLSRSPSWSCMWARGPWHESANQVPSLQDPFSNMWSALGSEPFLPMFWAHEPGPSTNICFICFLDFLDWLYLIHLSNKLYLSKKSQVISYASVLWDFFPLIWNWVLSYSLLTFTLSLKRNKIEIVQI